MSAEATAATKPQKILIVDDTPANIDILHKILLGDYVMYVARNGANALKIAQRELPDLILLDIMMPDMDGYQVCSALKNCPQTRGIPVIFVTAMETLEDEAKGLDCGAIDYLTKPISPPIVKARIRNHLELKRKTDLLEALTAELKDKNRQLDTLAREDDLTGVANRRHFNEVLAAEVKRANRGRQDLSLIMCDVDYFKKYNDHYGHIAGDRCLKGIGEALHATFRRAGDLSARYGGEEFAVILPETRPETALLLAEQFRHAVMSRAIPHVHSGVSGVVTVSIGVVGAQATGDHDASWFVAEADRALYRSKEGGRNRATLLTESDCESDSHSAPLSASNADPAKIQTSR